MTGLKASNPLHYLLARPYDPRLVRNKHTRLLRDRLNSASKLFKKNLVGHYGCVNAIEFSDKGDFLVSGGDDQRVLLWPTERAMDGLPCSPAVMQAQHKSNIFCLAIDSKVSRLFSGGNDDQVLVHDAVTGASVDNFLHEQPVYGLSLDPLCDSIFASACDDGRVLIYDIREPPSSDPLCLASSYAAYHAVMFNPVEPRSVVTANSQDGVGLWDVRRPLQRVSEFSASGAFQNCMSVRFNATGTQILALRRRLPPVIFRLDSPTPLVQFYHPEYYNSCTMKSCSFGGDKDQFVMSGSDDFNLYVWKIPDSDELNQWECETHMVLRGHRSIVNQVRFEPTKGIVASSGVEKIIKLWSTFELPRNCQTSPDDEEVARKVFSHEEYVSLVQRSDQLMSHNYSGQSLTEDMRMMAFFDSLVQREIQSWTSDEDTTLHSPTNSLVVGTSTSSFAALASPEEDGSAQAGGSGNRISQLIAQKRAQLVRLAKQERRTAALAANASDSDSTDAEMVAVRARFKRRRTTALRAIVPAAESPPESESASDSPAESPVVSRGESSPQSRAESPAESDSSSERPTPAKRSNVNGFGGLRSDSDSSTESPSLARRDNGFLSAQLRSDTDSSVDALTPATRSNANGFISAEFCDDSSSSELSTPVQQRVNGFLSAEFCEDSDSSVELSAPTKRSNSTPDSGISPEPCTSRTNANARESGGFVPKRAAAFVKKVLFAEKLSDSGEESDFTAFKKVKRQRRSYRKQAEESDSN